MRLWLLQDDVLEAMRDAREKITGYAPTAEERAEFLAAQIDARARSEGSLPRNAVVAGGTMQIDVQGVLTEEPDCFASLFGGGNTTYASIREALAAAESDPTIKDIVLNVKSPGGSVDGLFETFDALHRVTKPMRSVVSEATSAAYGLVAVAGPIEAKSMGTSVGSIGVATRMRKDPNAFDIASKEAPNKRPDVATEEGRAIVQARLDEVHQLFAVAIASGRERVLGEAVDAAHVNAEFGRGGVLLAADAKKRKMIDSVPKPTKRVPYGAQNASADNGGEIPKENSTMDLATLKASHPALFAAVSEEARAEGVKLGAETERKRVNAHLKMAEAAGDPKLATPFIASGASVQDDEVFATYQTASMNRNAQATRQTESDEAAKAVAGAKTPAAAGGEEAKDLGDLAVEALKAGR